MTWLKRLALSLLAIFLVVALVAWFKPLPGEAATPAGYQRNTAHYVAATDGTRIALDLWLPEDLSPDARIPTLIEGSRYWRDVRVTLAGRILNLFGSPGPGIVPGGSKRFFNHKGYAYVHVEVRGSGASFGVHQTEYSLDEVADYAAILDWIVAQPWSNGNVGSIGVSYAGTTAELMTTNAHPALKAAAPLYSDFDAQYHLVTPGGIYQPAFVTAWSNVVLAMDTNNTCVVIGAATYMECLFGKLFVGGIKPVDGPEGAELDAAIAEHDSPDPTFIVNSLKFRDSHWGEVGYSSLESQAYGRKAEIEASGVPMYVVSGWFDAATVEGTLARFMSFSNPQTVVIAPFSHGGSHDTDSFRLAGEAPIWSSLEQLIQLEAFFAAHLKNEGEPSGRALSYYVMNGGWKASDVWPPVGFADRHYYLQEDSSLAPAAAPIQSSTTYPVNFETGTEEATRWMTQLGGGDVFYDDRNAATETALRFESAAFEADMELTGTVTLSLTLTADQPDGALHAYLDAVAPDGKAHYLTEGVLGLRHRKVSSDVPVYPHFGPYHSFLEQDAEDIPVGKPTTVELGLFTTSAKIPAGYRLRLSLAGADATSFARLPAEGPAPIWQVHHGGVSPSRITAPMRPWTATGAIP